MLPPNARWGETHQDATGRMAERELAMKERCYDLNVRGDERLSGNYIASSGIKEHGIECGN